MEILTKTVVVVEDSAAVRERLRTLLSETPGVALLAEYSTVDQATAGMALVAPDAVVLDIKLGSLNTIGLVRFIKQRHPRTTLMMYTHFSDLAHRDAYLQAGADLFFDKVSETPQLLSALGRLSTH